LNCESALHSESCTVRVLRTVRDSLRSSRCEALAAKLSQPQALTSKLSLRSILSILFLVSLSMAYPALRKEFSDLDKMYEAGKINEISDEITNLKPSNDDERACISFYNARLKLATSEEIASLNWLIEKFPNSYYAHLGRLELGKIYILERRIDQAQLLLRKITSSDLMERFYWLALCDWWIDDFATAISNAETYLRMDPKGPYAESAYYLIAESYIEQKKAYSALTTLGKLQNLKLSELDEQYFYYRQGYAYELSDKLVDSVASYRKGYELNKYSQVAYLIEDKLFELRSRSRNIDISFLYPYSLLQIAITNEEPTEQNPATPVSQNGVIPTPHIPQRSDPVNLNTPVKMKAKPGEGYWLQAGRFSQEANANKLVINLRLLNLPAVYYEDTSTGKKTWVVVCGPFTDKTAAETSRKSLADNDINSFLTQY